MALAKFLAALLAMLTLLGAIQAKAEGGALGRDWVGTTEDVVTRELQSKGWVLLRHASTGAHSWASWMSEAASKCLVTEYTNGKAVLVRSTPEQECFSAARSVAVVEPTMSEPQVENSGLEN